tara:strand:- start:309 stop:1406 length:1098 start_codon:yes stop_codon:yes gene_type:complete
MRATELFIQSNLAISCQRMGDVDAALPHFRRASEISAEVMANPFEDATLASEALHAYALLCAEHGLSEDAEAAANRIEVLPLTSEITLNRSAIQQIAQSRFRFITEGADGIKSSFESSIQTLVFKFGVRSNPVQFQYAAYVQVLLDFGLRDEAFAIIRRRLLDLDYWYQNRLIFDRPASDSARQLEQRRTIAAFNSRARSREEKLKALDAAASEIYGSGDHDAAFKAYLEAADLGSIDSQFMVGTLYQCGIGCEIDMEKAREYYAYAAERGHKIAQHYYGALLQMGLGGPVDMEAAVYWYYRAVLQGFPAAFDNLYAAYSLTASGQVSRCFLIELKLRAAENGVSGALDQAMELFRSPVETLVKV